jgi:hypothetical protein
MQQRDDVQWGLQPADVRVDRAEGRCSPRLTGRASIFWSTQSEKMEHARRRAPPVQQLDSICRLVGDPLQDVAGMTP